jgi:nucleotide-binding universal stress UspA family protein
VYRNILVGSDGSETAARAVDRAVDLARTLGARVTVLSAGRPERAQQVVDREAARHADSGVEISTRVSEADPTTALIETAERGQHDLLVVGNKGMTGVTRFFHLGSVPNKVSHHLPCTLLIVRTT